MEETLSGRRKKILVPIFNRAHLGRLRPMLGAIQDHPALELQVMVASHAVHGSVYSALKHGDPLSFGQALPWYLKARLSFVAHRLGFGNGVAYDHIARKVTEAGFPVNSRLPLFLEGSTPSTMAKSVGVGLVKMIDECARLKPDMMFIHADRFEMMAPTLAAAYLNIPMAHNEAGDVSGTIDESVRHAITKFAHVHFAVTEASRRRVIQMGENPAFVFTVGSPAIDAVARLDLSIPPAIAGYSFDKPYLLVMVHPVTTQSDEENRRMIEEVCLALESVKMPAFIVGGNADAYARIIGPAIVAWMNARVPPDISYVKWLHPDAYLRVLANASCAIGNSSSFLREGAYMGTPAVIVGSRQQGRERGPNALEVAAAHHEIVIWVRRQLAHGRYPRDTKFGAGDAAGKIADILARVNPPIQKQFFDI